MSASYGRPQRSYVHARRRSTQPPVAVAASDGRPLVEAGPASPRNRFPRSREEAAKIFDGLVPLGRHTTPEEISHAALYLAADESAMVTSHTFSIDGGLSG
jgi:NAD(P)-dependent dehydrogenase (short-subunit alcohol dehydrogenase family)